MIIELGRLTYPVKLDTVKVKDSEKKVLNNRLAIPINKDKSTFIDIVAWGTTAELINKHFKKGFEILVQGTLINNTRKKENVEFETVVLLIEKVLFTHGNPRELEEVPDFLVGGGGN